MCCERKTGTHPIAAPSLQHRHPTVRRRRNDATDPMAMPALDNVAIQTQAIAPYVVSVLDRLDLEAALELWARAATAGVFNHPTWWQAALDAFGERRPLRVVAVYQASTLVALWPLWVNRLGAREGFARIIEPIGARVTDYCMPLLAKDHDPGHLIDLLMHTTCKCLMRRPCSFGRKYRSPTLIAIQSIACSSIRARFSENMSVRAPRCPCQSATKISSSDGARAIAATSGDRSKG